MNPERVAKMVQAIETGDAKSVRLLLKLGLPPNHLIPGHASKPGRPLLHHAARRARAEVFHLLLESGADIHSLDRSFDTEPESLLEAACFPLSPSLEIVATILAQASPAPALLHRALRIAAEGKLPLLETLLAAGADPNDPDADGDTALVIAVLNSAEAAALALLAAGADPRRLVRSPRFAPHQNRSLLAVAEDLGLTQLLAPLAGAAPPAPSASLPATIPAAWQALDVALAAARRTEPSLAPFPGPFTGSFAAPPLDLLATPAAAQLRASLALHDGSGSHGFALRPHDAGYQLLSVADSLAALAERIAVFGSPAAWWPLATNGAGDYLLLDTADPSGPVLFFSHESGRAVPHAPSLLAVLQRASL